MSPVVGVMVAVGATVTDNVALLPELEPPSLCSANPAVSRDWGIHNPVSFPVTYTW